MAKLSPNDTIISVFRSLERRDDYKNNVIQKLWNCKDKHGNSFVKIGLTGKGAKPCFRIFYVQDQAEHIFGSYWDMGDPLTNDKADTSNWCTASVSYEKFLTFLERDKSRSR